MGWKLTIILSAKVQLEAAKDRLVCRPENHCHLRDVCGIWKKNDTVLELQRSEE